jgi:hypothetical protein
VTKKRRKAVTDGRKVMKEKGDKGRKVVAGMNDARKERRTKMERRKKRGEGGGDRRREGEERERDMHDGRGLRETYSFPCKYTVEWWSIP